MSNVTLVVKDRTTFDGDPVEKEVQFQSEGLDSFKHFVSAYFHSVFFQTNDFLVCRSAYDVAFSGFLSNTFWKRLSST